MRFNTQPRPKHLSCQLPPPATLREYSWKRSEPSPARSSLPRSSQSSRRLSYPLLQRFQAISPLIADEWAHHPPANDRRKTLFTPRRQRLNKKNWRNTQQLHLNQLHVDPRFSPPTHLMWATFHPPWDKPLSIPTIIIQPTKKISSSQQKNLSFQTLTYIPRRTSTSSQMVRFEIESRMAVTDNSSSVKMTSFTSGTLQRAPVLAPSRK